MYKGLTISKQIILLSFVTSGTAGRFIKYYSQFFNEEN